MTTHHDLERANRHAPISFAYDDLTEREASTHESVDVEKFARQLDDDSLWWISAVDVYGIATWEEMGGGSGVTMDEADGAAIYHRFDTPDAADDEFIGDTLTGWTQVDGFTTGSITWSQKHHAAHALFTGNENSKIGAQVKAVTLADGEAFETLLHQTQALNDVQYPFAGILIANGVSVGSNVWGVGMYQDGTTPRLFIWSGTYETFSTTVLLETPYVSFMSDLRLRLYRTNSTNFGVKVSTHNGHVFVPRPFAGTTYNPGFTPTHAGMFCTSYGSSNKFVASWDFFRKVTE